MVNFAEMPDEFIVLPMLVGLSYAILVQTGKVFGLADLWPSVFGTRVRPLAISCLSIGFGLVLASAKFGALKDAAANFYGLAGCFLIFVGMYLLFRRVDA